MTTFTRLTDTRAAIAVRLQTVTTGAPSVRSSDGLGEEINGNTILIGVPSVGFAKSSPFEPDVEVGSRELEVRWPITAYLPRAAGIVTIVDRFLEDVTLALLSDDTLGGTVLDIALEQVTVNDDDPDVTTRHHVLAWELVTALHIREGSP